MDITRTTADVRRDIQTCRDAMNNPKVGLFAMKRLYAVYGALLRELDRLEKEDNHGKAE